MNLRNYPAMLFGIGMILGSMGNLTNSRIIGGGLVVATIVFHFMSAIVEYWKEEEGSE